MSVIKESKHYGLSRIVTLSRRPTIPSFTEKQKKKQSIAMDLGLSRIMFELNRRVLILNRSRNGASFKSFKCDHLSKKQLTSDSNFNVSGSFD
jgi:hypothetical protein